MVKKIISAGLFTVLILVLIAGAVNRTLAKSLENQNLQNGESGKGFGYQDQAYQNEDSAVETGNGRGKQGGIGGRGREEAQIEPENGVMPGVESREQSNLTEGGTAAWFTVETRVQSSTRENLILSSPGGQVYTIEGRAWRFSQEQGFFPAEGEAISVTGYFDEQGVFRAVQLANIDHDIHLVIRDQYGRPMWAGSHD